MQEEADRHALRVPVLQAGSRLLLDVEQDALVVDGVLALHADGVRHLGQDESVAVGRQRLFVAFQRLVLGDAVAGELHAKAEGDLVALLLLGFGLQMDDAVRVLADERGDVGRHQRFRREHLCVPLGRKSVTHPVSGHSHGGILSG